MSAGKTAAQLARAAAHNKAVQGIAASIAAGAASKLEPALRQRYDRWRDHRLDLDRAIKLARQIRGRYSDETIIGGKPHVVVWKDGVAVEAFPPVPDLELRPELRDFDENLMLVPPPPRAPRRRLPGA